MKNKNVIIYGILSVVIFISGCTSPTPQPLEVTRIVPQTVIVTQIVERVISATPEPATPTPTLTSKPEVTPTPDFVRWNSTQMVDAFITAGLEASSPRPMTVDDYGFAPLVAIEGTRFLIPSLCAECGGRILSFASLEDLEKSRAYYVDLGRESAAFYSWTFVKDNILVQINGDLPEEKAQQYEAALNAMD